MDGADFASPGAPPAKGPDSAGMTPLHQKFIGAVKDEWQLFSDQACDYTIGEPIGFGASSIVYTAQWKPVSEPEGKPIPCALKVLDLDSLPPRSLQLLQRETTLMSLSKHPNVLRVRGSWMDGHKLFIALRLMNKGSAADVMHYGWPGGMEEEVIKCILRQALKGLNYLHVNGFIHRDVKAANLLIDDDGTVLLGDLGVAADLSEDPQHHQSSSSSRSKSSTITATAALLQPRVMSAVTGGSNEDGQVMCASPPRPPMGKRKSFVGTPCWMAPELIQGKQYDASADIWSFAITALELSQGHPPRFRESPQRVLLRTLQEEPATLNREGNTYKYTRAFKDMVDSCLIKDPSKRPTAEQLLQNPFFRSAKKKSYLVNAVLKELPPLVQRQERKLLAQPASPSSVDSWNFSTTINSPSTSIMRYRALEEFVAAEELEELANGAVFEMEADGRLTPPPTKRFKYPQKTFSPTIDHAEFNSTENDEKPAEPSSTTTGSEISPDSLAISTDGSASDTSTASSSYVAPSSVSSDANGSVELPLSTDLPPPSPPISQAESEAPRYPKLELTVTAHNQCLSPHSTFSSISQKPLGLVQQIQSASTESDLQKRAKPSTGLWKKFKNNLKISSSSALAGQGEDPKSVSKKSKPGSLLANAGKGSIGKSNKSLNQGK